jgi:hypothetical protein
MGIGLLYLWQSSDLSGRMSLNLAGICGLIGFTTALGSSPVFWDLSFATLELRGSGVVRCIYSSSMYVQAPALVAQPSSEALALADSLLRCVAFPSCDWEIAESTLQFWCTLAEYLLAAEETQDQLKQQALAAYIPVYTALLDALVIRAQVGDSDYVEDDLDGISGLPDGLTLFRKNLDEPLADICRLLGPIQFLATVGLAFKTWMLFSMIFLLLMSE